MTRRETALVLRDGAPLRQGPFTLSQTGLTARGTPSFTEWEECGAVLRQIEGTVQWWIGDWLNFGESVYGHSSPRCKTGRRPARSGRSRRNGSTSARCGRP